MSAPPPIDGVRESGAEPEFRRKRGISIVWLIPVVAAVVGASVAYETFSNKGPTIKLVLTDGSGLEAGKTKVEYLDVQIGTVTKVRLSEDLNSVIAEAELDKKTEPLLTEGTIFWMVRPRITLEGISGIGTLVSGDFITMLPGPGKATRKFQILDDPPLQAEHRGALGIELVADDLGSVRVGSPVTYLGNTVGQVEKYELLGDDHSFEIHVLIDRNYAHLVRTRTQFWNASGLDVSVGADGVSIRTASVATLLEGGIAFATPAWAEDAAPAKAGARFGLYASQKSAEQAGERVDGLNVVVEARDGSIPEGAPVYYRKQRVGHVGKSALSPDATSVRYQVHVDARYAPLISTNSRFWKAGGVNMHLGIDGLDLRTDSLESILEGGLEFATPDAPSPRARSGTLFALYDEPQKEWLAWAPKIWLGDDKGGRHVAHVLPPATEKPAGLEIILESFSSGAVKPGDPIYYRKVKVGEIGEHELSEDSKTVRIHARIAPQHAMLVRANSRFWNASGITAHLGLGGVDVQTESLESMMAGGVAFATPDEPGDAVEPLTIFPLHPKAQDEWERWSPTIWVEPAKPGEVVEHAIQADTHPELFEKPVTRESVDPEPEPGSSPATPAEEAHPPEPVGFFRRLFGGGR